MNASLHERLGNLSVSVVCDVLRYAGAPHQCLHHSVRAMAGYDGRRSLVGPAFCVRAEKGGAKPQGKGNLRFEMYRRIQPGAIVVLASGGYRDAVAFGGNVVLGLKMHRCRGVVTDGGFRDRRDMDEMQMPVFASFVTPVSSGGELVTMELECPVTMPGQASEAVVVNPGDIVMGDPDGVVIIPAASLATIVEDAEIFQEMEERTRRDILAGGDVEAAYSGSNRSRHIRPLTPLKR